ncbi:MAG: ABC transporter permease [Desulfobacterales bacterium]
MNFKRFWTMFKARNREFYRDRAGLGWNIIFPFLLVAGFGVIFGSEQRAEYKVGVFPSTINSPEAGSLALPPRFLETRYVQFVGFATQAQGLDKLAHHKIDFLVAQGEAPYRYWISHDSPKGYFIEKIFREALLDDALLAALARKEAISGDAIRYVDWLFPGIIGMNMMFSALWGVGYVVVRYRKIGVLKRLNATPLTAFEYLSAQMVSRVGILMFSLAVVWLGCDLLFDFRVSGSYLNLVLMFLLGSLCLSALGLLLASRGISEEFTTGVLNFISWPMMFLSEVWFSLEGAPDWVIRIAQIFPLTHLLRGVRRVMHDGAGLAEVAPEVGILAGMTLLFLISGAALFSWNR